MIKYFPVAALAAVALFGQSENSSTLQGFVRDSQGAPVAAATVQIKINGQTVTAVTNSSGNYTFRDLRGVPIDQRQTVLNSNRYQGVFSPEERGILSDILRAEPYQPAH